MYQAFCAVNSAIQAHRSSRSFSDKADGGSSPLCEEHSLYLAALSSCLHEPVDKICRLLRANKSFLQRVDHYRNTMQKSAQLHRHLASFRFSQKKEYKKAISQYPGSRMLVSFHFGDFIYSNNLVAGHEEENRSQCFLTQLPPTEAFRSNMVRCFGEHEFANRQQLTTNAETPTRLISRLKKQSTTLLTFVDLPSGFGQRIKVTFLGRDAWFPKGPALLCVAAQVPIIPVLSYQSGEINHITVHPIIEPAPNEGESRGSACIRITQALVNILEAYLRMYPWQWRYLSALPAFFNESESPAGKACSQPVRARVGTG